MDKCGWVGGEGRVGGVGAREMWGRRDADVWLSIRVRSFSYFMVVLVFFLFLYNIFIFCCRAYCYVAVVFFILYLSLVIPHA